MEHSMLCNCSFLCADYSSWSLCSHCFFGMFWCAWTPNWGLCSGICVYTMLVVCCLQAFPSVACGWLVLKSTGVEKIPPLASIHQVDLDGTWIFLLPVLLSSCRKHFCSELTVRLCLFLFCRQILFVLYKQFKILLVL